MKQEMGIVEMRTVLELRGMPCLPLELCPQPRQSHMVSRSFGRPVESLEELKAIASVHDRLERADGSAVD